MLKGCDEPFLSPGTEHSSHEGMEKSWDSPILGYSFVDRLIFHSSIVNKACLLLGDDSSLIMLNNSNSMLGCCFPCALPKREVSALHSSICWKKARNTIILLLLPPPPFSQKNGLFAWNVKEMIHRRHGAPFAGISNQSGKFLHSWASSASFKIRSAQCLPSMLQIWAAMRTRCTPSPLVFPAQTCPKG